MAKIFTLKGFLLNPLRFLVVWNIKYLTITVYYSYVAKSRTRFTFLKIFLDKHRAIL